MWLITNASFFVYGNQMNQNPTLIAVFLLQEWGFWSSLQPLVDDVMLICEQYRQSSCTNKLVIIKNHLDCFNEEVLIFINYHTPIL